MTAIVTLDDTDSRERGMCTTYAGTRLGEELEAEGATVRDHLLIRCNPAVEHKTRGNAAVALHVDADPETAFDIARAQITTLAETDDPNTNPGLVVAPHGPEAIPDPIATFAREAVRDHHRIEDADELIDEYDYLAAGWGVGRGKIGALAAVGAPAASDDRTYELIAYREPERWGTERAVDPDSVFAAADRGYPEVWDTVDRVEGEPVCVPHTPGPVLYGIRGDDPEAVRAVAADIESEPIDRRTLFVTNQGTDAHLRDGSIGTLHEGRSYRTTGTVSEPPETRTGGHVFVTLREHETDLSCAAFEPTKRFRNRVRALRVGDRVTVCGELGDGTLKIEKFAVRDLVETEPTTPDCPECGRSMKSAGANQGYRCRDCGTDAPGKVDRPIDRDLEHGWYEVPPVARRHIAKPLVRGGFDAPVHPER